MNILLFGPPGSGKGTQSALLVEDLGFTHISTGNMFRQHIHNGTDLGKKAKEYMDEGLLVPDELTIAMVRRELEEQRELDFIFDGFPRNVAQAQAFEQLLAELEMNLDSAIFLDVPVDVIVERLSGRRVCKNCGAVYHIANHMPHEEGVCENCGTGPIYQREDDKPEAIKTRLKVYDENTAPLRELYERNGRLVVIDGDADEATVYRKIKSQIQTKKM